MHVYAIIKKEICIIDSLFVIIFFALSVCSLSFFVQLQVFFYYSKISLSKIFEMEYNSKE